MNSPYFDLSVTPTDHGTLLIVGVMGGQELWRLNTTTTGALTIIRMLQDGLASMAPEPAIARGVEMPVYFLSEN